MQAFQHNQSKGTVLQNEDFIKEIDGALPQEMCLSLIDTFGMIEEAGGSFTRQTSEGAKKDFKVDTAISANEILLSCFNANQNKGILDTINQHILKYVQNFETGMFSYVVGENFPISQSGIKLQKTSPSEGYHVWHCENASQLYSKRFITWIIYLNDVSEGGETEFIHLSKRIAPKQGRMVIFPAGWTHSHRGNPPLTEDKYILTGWMEYTT
jgi:hypothetical protein